MATGWFDDGLEESFDPEDAEEPLYCPYTNSTKCAIEAHGWPVQELCEAVECDQLKFFQRGKRRHHKAA